VSPLLCVFPKSEEIVPKASWTEGLFGNYRASSAAQQLSDMTGFANPQDRTWLRPWRSIRHVTGNMRFVADSSNPAQGTTVLRLQWVACHALRKQRTWLRCYGFSPSSKDRHEKTVNGDVALALRGPMRIWPSKAKAQREYAIDEWRGCRPSALTHRRIAGEGVVVQRPHVHLKEAVEIILAPDPVLSYMLLSYMLPNLHSGTKGFALSPCFSKCGQKTITTALSSALVRVHLMCPGSKLG